jgi:hypothetical protein
LTKRTSAPPKTPLRWPGILFAFAANTLAVTLTDSLVRRLSLGLNAETLATVVAPLLAGMATALYTGSRGGMHALAGSIIAVPVLLFFVFGGAWPLAVFAAAFCTMGAALTELGQRRPKR